MEHGFLDKQPHPSPPPRGGSKTPPPWEGAGGRPVRVKN
jgi:hypothetical protein